MHRVLLSSVCALLVFASSPASANGPGPQGTPPHPAARVEVTGTFPVHSGQFPVADCSEVRFSVSAPNLPGKLETYGVGHINPSKTCSYALSIPTGVEATIERFAPGSDTPNWTVKATLDAAHAKVDVPAMDIGSGGALLATVLLTAPGTPKGTCANVLVRASSAPPNVRMGSGGAPSSGLQKAIVVEGVGSPGAPSTCTVHLTGLRPGTATVEVFSKFNGEPMTSLVAVGRVAKLEVAIVADAQATAGFSVAWPSDPPKVHGIVRFTALQAYGLPTYSAEIAHLTKILDSAGGPQKICSKIQICAAHTDGGACGSRPPVTNGTMASGAVTVQGKTCAYEMVVPANTTLNVSVFLPVDMEGIGTWQAKDSSIPALAPGANVAADPLFLFPVVSH